MIAIWKIVCRQFRQNRFVFLLGLGVAFIPVLAGVLLLGVAGWFITVAAMAGATGAFLNIFAPSAIIRALALLRTAGRYGERMITHDATFRFVTDLRNRLFSSMATKTEQESRSGAALNRLTLDVAAMDAIYLRLVVPGFLLIGISAVLLTVWSTMPVVVLLCGVLLLSFWAIVVVIVMTGQTANHARRADAALEAMRIRAADFSAGRRDLSIYGGLEAAARPIEAADQRLESAERILEARSIRSSVLTSFWGQLFLAAMVLAAVAAVTAFGLAPAIAVGLVLSAIAVPEVFSQILPGLARSPRVARAAQRVEGLLGERMDYKAHVSPPPATWVAGGGLTFKKVLFQYPRAERPVLEALSLEVGAGEVVAIAGRSGCGKSTVAALAARQRTPGDGTIDFNGVDLQTIPESVLRKKITVLSQRPYVFNETVAYNLRIASPDASDTELWIALAQAALASRISDSAMGLETVLGEGGLGLSGGELRRLSLAQAFLTSPDLFILDEMTEGLDLETAADVLERFLAFRGKASVLMIAHKPLELQSADRIVHLSEVAMHGNSTRF